MVRRAFARRAAPAAGRRTATAALQAGPPLECNALSGVRRGTDHVDNELGVGQHWYVTAGDLVNRSPHAFRDEALQVGRHGAVIRGHDVPTRLRLPRSTGGILGEQVRGWREVGSPDNLLLLLR